MEFNVKGKRLIKPLYEQGCFTKSEYLKIWSKGSKRSILFGQAKVYKLVEDNCSSLRPILSVICTPRYELAKFLVSLSKPLNGNKYTVHDSFSLASEVSKFNSNNLMTGLDIEETIDNIINDLFLTTNKVHNFEPEKLKQHLIFAAYQSFFL